MRCGPHRQSVGGSNQCEDCARRSPHHSSGRSTHRPQCDRPLGHGSCTVLQLEGVLVTHCLLAGLASCSQLSTLQLTDSAFLEAGEAPGQAVLDAVLPRVLTHVTKLRIDNAQSLPVVHALAPQLLELQMGKAAHDAPLALPPGDMAKLAAAVARCGKMRTAHLYSISAGAALFDALMVTPVQTVSVARLSFSEGEGSRDAQCTWRLNVGVAMGDDLPRLPFGHLASLHVEVLGLSGEPNSMSVLQQARVMSMGLVFMGQHAAVSMLRELRPVAARAKPHTLCLTSTDSWTPTRELVAAAAEVFAGNLLVLVLERPVLTSGFWLALQQAPQQQLSKISAVALTSCTDLGAIGLSAFAAAMPPRPSPLLVKLQDCGEQVVAAAREVQAVLADMAGPPRVLIEIV